jgi:hypothetical protein
MWKCGHINSSIFDRAIRKSIEYAIDKKLCKPYELFVRSATKIFNGDFVDDEVVMKVHFVMYYHYRPDINHIDKMVDWIKQELPDYSLSQIKNAVKIIRMKFMDNNKQLVNNVEDFIEDK